MNENYNENRQNDEWVDYQYSDKTTVQYTPEDEPTEINLVYTIRLYQNHKVEVDEDSWVNEYDFDSFEEGNLAAWKNPNLIGTWSVEELPSGEKCLTFDLQRNNRFHYYYESWSEGKHRVAIFDGRLYIITDPLDGKGSYRDSVSSMSKHPSWLPQTNQLPERIPCVPEKEENTLQDNPENHTTVDEPIINDSPSKMTWWEVILGLAIWAFILWILFRIFS